MGGRTEEILFSLLKVQMKKQLYGRDPFHNKDMKNTKFFVYSYNTVCFCLRSFETLFYIKDL